MTDIGPSRAGPGFDGFADAERQARIDAMTHRPLQIDPRAVAVSEGARALNPFPLNIPKMIFGHPSRDIAADVAMGFGDLGAIGREHLLRLQQGEGTPFDVGMATVGPLAGLASIASGPSSMLYKGAASRALSPLTTMAGQEAMRLGRLAAPAVAPAAAGIALAPGEAEGAPLPTAPFSNLVWNLRRGFKGDTAPQVASQWRQRFANPLPPINIEGVTFKGGPKEEQELLQRYLDLMQHGPEAGTPITKEQLADRMEENVLPRLYTKHLGHGPNFYDVPQHDIKGRILPGEVKFRSSEEILSQWGEHSLASGPKPTMKQLNFPSLQNPNIDEALAPLSDAFGVPVDDMLRLGGGSLAANVAARSSFMLRFIREAVEEGVLTPDVARGIQRAVNEDQERISDFKRLVAEYENPKVAYQAPSIHYAGKLGENLLAHSRSTVRESAVTGKSSRLVDESQSDLHQAALDAGYAPSFMDDLEEASLRKRAESGQLSDAEQVRLRELEQNRLDTDDQARRAETDPARKIVPRLPDAPLKKDWQQYQLKQEFARAIENGDDSLALVPGRVQTQRWSLMNHLGKIEWDPSTGAVKFYNVDGDLMSNERLPKEIKEGALASHIGKETARKLIAAKPDAAAADAAFKKHRWYEGMDSEYKRPIAELGEDRQRVIDYAQEKRGRIVDPARAEYDRIVDLASAEHNSIVNPANAEHKRIVNRARADHNHIVTPARAEFNRIVDPARAEFNRIVTPARAEYERIVDLASAEHNRREGIVTPARAEYERIVTPARAEYDRIVDPARAEYNRIVDLASAEHNSIVNPASREYKRIVDRARAEFNRIVDLASAEHNSIVGLASAEYDFFVGLLSPRFNTLEGRELRVGGAGSRMSYDRDQPASMEKIAKQYGDPKAKIVTDKIQTGKTLDIDQFSGLWDDDKAFPDKRTVSQFIRELDNVWVSEADMAAIFPKLDALEKMAKDIDHTPGPAADTLAAFNKARAEFGRDIAALEDKYKFSTGVELEVHSMPITDRMRDAYYRVKNKTGSGFSRYAVPPVATLPFFESLYGEQPQEEFNAP